MSATLSRPEPPGQNVSIVSQFETFLTFETQLRLPLFESNLRAI